VLHQLILQRRRRVSKKNSSIIFTQNQCIGDTGFG
jgi:hypothetical protein